MSTPEAASTTPSGSRGAPERGPAELVTDCWKRIGVWGDRQCPELPQHIHCRNCPVFSLAARQLLDREPPPDYRATWSAHFAAPRTVAESDARSVLVFRLGVEWLALPTSLLVEVAAQRPIHSLPHPRGQLVLGVVNVRGELLVCVSLGALLGLDQPSAGTKPSRHARPRVLVLRQAGRRLAFPVDEVKGVERVRPGEVRAAPATVAKALATFSTGVWLWQDTTVGLLDEQRLLHTLNRSLG